MVIGGFTARVRQILRSAVPRRRCGVRFIPSIDPFDPCPSARLSTDYKRDLITDTTTAGPKKGPEGDQGRRGRSSAGETRPDQESGPDRCEEV